MTTIRVTNQRDFLREIVSARGKTIEVAEPFTVGGPEMSRVLIDRPDLTVRGNDMLRMHTLVQVEDPDYLYWSGTEFCSFWNARKPMLIYSTGQAGAVGIDKCSFIGRCDELLTCWKPKHSDASLARLEVTNCAFIPHPLSHKEGSPHAYPALFLDVTSGRMEGCVFGPGHRRFPSLNRCGTPDAPFEVVNNVALDCAETGAIVTAESPDERGHLLPPGREQGCWADFAGNIWNGSFRGGNPVWVKERRDGMGGTGVEFWASGNYWPEVGFTNREDLIKDVTSLTHLLPGEEFADLVVKAGPNMVPTHIDGMMSLSVARIKASALVMSYADEPDEPPVDEEPACCGELRGRVEKLESLQENWPLQWAHNREAATAFDGIKKDLSKIKARLARLERPWWRRGRRRSELEAEND